MKILRLIYRLTAKKYPNLSYSAPFQSDPRQKAHHLGLPIEILQGQILYQVRVAFTMLHGPKQG